jgi:hypothetical protein
MLSPKMFRSRQQRSESTATEDSKEEKRRQNRSSSSQTDINRNSRKSQDSAPVVKATSTDSLIFGDVLFKNKKPADYFRQNIGTYFVRNFTVSRGR